MPMAPEAEGIQLKNVTPAQWDRILPIGIIHREDPNKNQSFQQGVIPIKNNGMEQMEYHGPPPPPIIPMVGSWDAGVNAPRCGDFYARRKDIRSRYVADPALMTITKPEHFEANPQSQAGSWPVAKPQRPAPPVQKTRNSGGWLRWFFGEKEEVPQMTRIPDDKPNSIVWDQNLHRWVNASPMPKTENKPVPPPPPMGMYLGNSSLPKGVNPYSMKAADQGSLGDRYPKLLYHGGITTTPPYQGPGSLPAQHATLMAPMTVPFDFDRQKLGPGTLPF
uniref:protein transport protein Sec16A-like n=1 Tax=Oncorhynchus gorbuscha TaxID=8017 RepID=UPI001EAEB134|nr:protein transport protein Sec16A-like [Oncorhynchus gorbuscha]XP_046147883.1 protein transport protein Sec16A-like [Oncorhynchus gorbuscha]XP_046147884.1 protein transport protein Sec16A-like [Oncorhynchus gorbuscha]